MIQKKQNVKEILDQLEWFSYQDLDDLVYHIQSKQIEMRDNNT